MAQDRGDGLVVAAAFDAAGGERVAQGMEADGRQSEAREDPPGKIKYT